MTPQDNNLRKSAILLSSLDPESAEALYDKMTPPQAERVREEIAALGEVPAEERTAVVDEFVRMGNVAPRPVAPGIEMDATLAARFRRIDRILGPDDRVVVGERDTAAP